MNLPELPIDSYLSGILKILESGRNLVLCAEPGAGKTTRVPRSLLDAGLLQHGELWVLEPRRLAARLAAMRVADELGEDIGQRVGYAVRFEQRVSKATRIRFVTEGLLLRRIQDDPLLKGISVVILDEFHERHLHTDLALALLRRLQKTARPDLRIVVMSATLDAQPVCAFLDAESLHCLGRSHPLEIRYAARPDDRPLNQRVKEALGQLMSERAEGHALVFLPGAREIRECERVLAGLESALGFRLFTLHGSLGLEAQKAAVAPTWERKIILSTNVAESSVTIDGVSIVVDSGLARQSQHSTWSGLSSLRTGRISQARCIQRAGRAARQGPGLCLRLFTENEFRMRADFDEPEISRSDLSEALLALHGIGVAEPAGMHWFEPPPTRALEAAEKLLARLHALDEQGALTDTGRQMAAMPLHPRLARLVVAGRALGIAELACLTAALLETGDLKARAGLSASRPGAAHGLDSDLWARLDDFEEVAQAGFNAGAIRAAGLDGGQLRQARQAFESLQRSVGLTGTRTGWDGQSRTSGASVGASRLSASPDSTSAPSALPTGTRTGWDDDKLLQALLYAYPDRLAKGGGAFTYALLGGGGARLDPSSRVKAPLIVAVEAEERAGRSSEVVITLASRVEMEWLLEVAPESLREQRELLFNAQNKRVERVDRIYFEDLCIEETRCGADPDHPETAKALCDALLPMYADDALDVLLHRLTFLSSQRQDLEIHSESLRRDLLERACLGRRSLKDLEGVDWRWLAQECLGSEAMHLLAQWAPEFVQLPRRRVKIHYDQASPWIESRLQDFLGLKDGPRIANGGVPLVLHLLAPNYRAVQVTTDLAGFWERAYRELRPQLSRRYPRHAWPEKPWETLV